MFENLNPSEDFYKMITSVEQYKKILNWLMRLNEYRTGEATVADNVYMKPQAKSSEFTRVRSILERMNISLNGVKIVAPESVVDKMKERILALYNDYFENIIV